MRRRKKTGRPRSRRKETLKRKGTSSLGNLPSSPDDKHHKKNSSPESAERQKGSENYHGEEEEFYRVSGEEKRGEDGKRTYRNLDHS